METQPTSNPLVVRLSGEVTLLDGGNLKTRLIEALSAPAAILDCSELASIDLAGLQLVLAAVRAFARDGKPLSLTDSPAGVLHTAASVAGLSLEGAAL